MSAPVLPIVAGVPVPSVPDGRDWDSAFAKALGEKITLSPLSRTRAGDKWRVSALASSASGNGPYRVAVEGFGDPLADPDVASCSCPGGAKSQKCKHVAVLLALLGMI